MFRQKREENREDTLAQAILQLTEPARGETSEVSPLPLHWQLLPQSVRRDSVQFGGDQVRPGLPRCLAVLVQRDPKPSRQSSQSDPLKLMASSEPRAFDDPSVLVGSIGHLQLLPQEVRHHNPS